MPDHVTVWLVGAGPMAVAYAAVLQDLGIVPLTIGRGKDSAAAFSRKTGLAVQPGGLEAFLATRPAPAHAAIVATSVPQLLRTTTALLDHGVRRVLVEKPGGVDVGEIDAAAAAASNSGAEAFVAYNRRFYASVAAAARMIAEDGGLTSITFEFTELADRVGPSPHPAAVKRNWLLANSTHVIDLAFHLAGPPADLAAFTAGSLGWHPAAARFAGSGITETGAAFSYHADWDAPGRWGVEAMTRARRLILRPLEQLQVQLRNSMDIHEVEIADELDRGYKPGVHAQTRAFLEGDSRLITIGDHARRCRSIYAVMLAGSAR